jgi:hypothetical protein
LIHRPEQEEEPEEPQDQAPSRPDPIIEPQIEMEPNAPLCLVCGDKDEGSEAKVKLSVHLCSEHAPAAKEMLQRLIAEIKSCVQILLSPRSGEDIEE